LTRRSGSAISTPSLATSWRNYTQTGSDGGAPIVGGTERGPHRRCGERRRDALSGLAGLGVELDEQRNTQPGKDARRISTDSSPITVLVIPTDEELAIARDCMRAID